MRVIRVSIVISMLLVMLAVQTVTATHGPAGPWSTRASRKCVGGTKIEAPQSGVGYIVFYDGFRDRSRSLNGTLSFATDQPAHVITSLSSRADRQTPSSTRGRTAPRIPV